MSLPFDSECPPHARVMIVDDHQAVIEMMAQVVASIPGHTVVGVALDAEAAMEICRRETPDLLIMDLAMPHVSGLSLLGELRKIVMQAKVMIFSGHLRPAAIREGLAAGVLGFVEKTAPLQEFREAISAVSAGKTYFDARASQMVWGIVHRQSGGKASDGAELTEREKTVLRLMAQGQSSKEIAQTLGISIHTVINHRSNLMKKTGLRRVAQLSLYAAESGLVGGLDETTLA